MLWIVLNDPAKMSPYCLLMQYQNTGRQPATQTPTGKAFAARTRCQVSASGAFTDVIQLTTRYRAFTIPARNLADALPRWLDIIGGRELQRCRGTPILRPDKRHRANRRGDGCSAWGRAGFATRPCRPHLAICRFCCKLSWRAERGLAAGFGQAAHWNSSATKAA